jgi:peptide methionine sulfoxide reductase msrA/msrB
MRLARRAVLFFASEAPMSVRTFVRLITLCMGVIALSACTRRAIPAQLDANIPSVETLGGRDAGPREGTQTAAAREGDQARSTPETAEALKKRIGALAFAVTQEAATEPAFDNAYWNEHRPGLFVDIVDGTPLFSSSDKFDSGTGWPSFTRPLRADAVSTTTDRSLLMERTEVRSATSGSHLGHLFDDGPAPLRTRYCMNSAALRFVPAENLEREGYGAYRSAIQGAPPAPTTAEACGVRDRPRTSGASGCQATTEVAIFAGGCFWGMEDILRKVPGVLETAAGYTGGSTSHPSYDDVHTGRTGHAEAVRIVFDPQKVSFRTLLDDWFFRMHDPTTPNRQGNDRGSQYRSAIFATSDAQLAEAEAAKGRAGQSGRWKSPIVTEVVRAGEFTPAEPEHQRYLERNPGGYTCHFMRD